MRGELCVCAGRCSRYQFECRRGGECIAVYNACDGVPQCADGSDEAPELGCPATLAAAATAPAPPAPPAPPHTHTHSHSHSHSPTTLRAPLQVRTRTHYHIMSRQCNFQWQFLSFIWLVLYHVTKKIATTFS